MHAHLVSKPGALGRRFTLWLFALLVIAVGLATPRAENSNAPKANYELASEWTTQKVGRLVFDTSVNPRWLETSDRFWYSYQTREGRKFYLVDPIKKNKATLFDHAKMAATLTSITREPYDSQHLPFHAVELAQKKADDPGIKEVQVTKDGEEHYSYARSAQDVQQQIEQQQQQQQQQQQDDQQQQQQQQQTENEQDLTSKNARMPPIPIIWSKDSKKFAVTRRDQRKVGDLWVIDSLASPRPKLETYRYAMPGEVNITQSEIDVFDIASRAMVKLKAEQFKDQTLQIATAPVPARLAGGGGRGGGQGAGTNPDAPEPQWLSETSDKLYFTRTSRDLHKV